jgi:hypothetical protein
MLLFGIFFLETQFPTLSFLLFRENIFFVVVLIPSEKKIGENTISGFSYFPFINMAINI